MGHTACVERSPFSVQYCCLIQFTFVDRRGSWVAKAKNGGLLVCGMLAVVVLYSILSGLPGSNDAPKAKFGDRQMVDFPVVLAPAANTRFRVASKQAVLDLAAPPPTPPPPLTKDWR